MATVIVRSLCVLSFASSTEERPRIYKQIIFTILSLGNIGAYRFSGDYFQPNPNPFIHAWSLSVEVQFYFLPPLLLLIFGYVVILTKNRVKNISLVLASLSLFLFMLSSLLHLAQPTLLPTPFDNFIFYSPISRFWQFAFGGWISFFTIQNHRRSAFANSCKSSVLLITLVLLFSPIELDSVLGAILATSAAMAIIYFECLSVVP